MHIWNYIFENAYLIPHIWKHIFENAYMKIYILKYIFEIKFISHPQGAVSHIKQKSVSNHFILCIISINNFTKHPNTIQISRLKNELRFSLVFQTFAFGPLEAKRCSLEISPKNIFVHQVMPIKNLISYWGAAPWGRRYKEETQQFKKWGTKFEFFEDRFGSVSYTHLTLPTTPYV